MGALCVGSPNPLPPNTPFPVASPRHYASRCGGAWNVARGTPLFGSVLHNHQVHRRFSLRLFFFLHGDVGGSGGILRIYLYAREHFAKPHSNPPWRSYSCNTYTHTHAFNGRFEPGNLVIISFCLFRSHRIVPVGFGGDGGRWGAVGRPGSAMCVCFVCMCRKLLWHLTTALAASPSNHVQDVQARIKFIHFICAALPYLCGSERCCCYCWWGGRCYAKMTSDT